MTEIVSNLYELITNNPENLILDAVKLAIGATLLIAGKYATMKLKTIGGFAFKYLIATPVMFFVPKKAVPLVEIKELKMEEKFSTDYCNMVYSLDDQFASWDEERNTLYGAGIQVEVTPTTQDLKCVAVGSDLVNVLLDMTYEEKIHFGKCIKTRITEIKERDRLRRREKAGYGLQTAKCGVAVSYPALSHKECKGK